MFRKIGEVASKAKEFIFPKPLHPDFDHRWTIKDDNGREFVWWGKGEWGTRPEATHKIGFAFDDVHQLDGIPEGFVAKMGLDVTEKNKYFALIYGYKNDVEEIKKWMKGRQLFRTKLMTYDGQPLEETEL